MAHVGSHTKPGNFAHSLRLQFPRNGAPEYSDTDKHSAFPKAKTDNSSDRRDVMPMMLCNETCCVSLCNPPMREATAHVAPQCPQARFRVSRWAAASGSQPSRHSTSTSSRSLRGLPRASR